MNNNTNQSEWIELEEMKAIHACAAGETGARLGMQLEDINGIVCSVSSAEPSILLNRCFVKDEKALTEVAMIEAVKRFYLENGIREFFLHVVNNSPDMTRCLEQAGMKKSRGWMKFIHNNEPVTARNTDLDIRKIGPEHAEDFARIAIPCFDLTDALLPLIVSLVHHPDYHLYMGFDNDRPAAAGALFYKDGTGFCDWGSTHRDFRGRGFQGALLARRINDGLSMGANAIYTATGEAVPGDPQHSYKNIMRYGFREYYLRENWVPA